jgi:hypothetical protein
VAAGAAVFLLVLALQWLLYSRLLKMDAPRRWIKSEVAFQAVVLVAAAGYILLMVRRHPAGIAWGAPGAAAVIANALALQVLLFRLMRMLREG